MTGNRIIEVGQEVRFDIVSLFPEMFAAVTEVGVTGRAVRNGLVTAGFWNPRDYTHDRHRTVDDRPFGGGPGMVMKFEPLQAAIRDAKAASDRPAKTIYLSPQGRKMDQKGILELAQHQRLVLICGRYEGIDERLIQTEVDEEWSVGDFVLSGGELPAMCLFDAVVRLLPGVLNHESSAVEDSFHNGLLDCPHYTRPEIYEGLKVPDVLLSGHHENIRRWRLQQALGRTWQRRPELLESYSLTKEEQILLDEFRQNQGFAEESGAEENE